MAIISALKPYYITQNTTTLTVRVKVYPRGGTAPTEWQHIFVKNSYDPLVAEDLRVDVSPVIRDYFNHVHENIMPTGVEIPVDGMELAVDIETNGPPTSNNIAYYSTNPPPLGQFHQFTNFQRQINKCQDNKVYLTFEATNVTTVRWETNNGHIHDEAVTPGTGIRVVPSIHSGLDLTDARTLTISLLGSGGAVASSQEYLLVHEYDTDESIGYVNILGAWEFFPILGKNTYTYTGEGKEYRSFEDGWLKAYNGNAETLVTVNTGWVDDGFYTVIYQLLASNHIVYYSGSNYDFGLVMTTKSVQRPHRIADKMINYTLNFRRVDKLIPIV